MKLERFLGSESSIALIKLTDDLVVAGSGWWWPTVTRVRIFDCFLVEEVLNCNTVEFWSHCRIDGAYTPILNCRRNEITLEQSCSVQGGISFSVENAFGVLVYWDVHVPYLYGPEWVNDLNTFCWVYMYPSPSRSKGNDKMGQTFRLSKAVNDDLYLCTI